MGITNLTIYTGQVKKWRVLSTPPTDPAPTPGDVYIDNTNNAYSLAIYNGTSWNFINLLT